MISQANQISDARSTISEKLSKTRYNKVTVHCSNHVFDLILDPFIELNVSPFFIRILR